VLHVESPPAALLMRAKSRAWRAAACCGRKSPGPFGVGIDMVRRHIMQGQARVGKKT
jgi:hypothetical protein